MKCPKCGYLGFEAVDRCRNCGYDFSFTPTSRPQELTIRSAEADNPQPLADLALIDSASRGRTADDRRDPVDDLGRQATPDRTADLANDLPLFAPVDADDAPLITRPSAPRQPLSVRRATLDVPRVRNEPRAAATGTTPMLDLEPSDFARRAGEPGPRRGLRVGTSVGVRREATAPEPASLGARVLAVAIDLLLLGITDIAVIYFTMQICGLTPEEAGLLPKGPLIAFLVVQNGGYLVTFTAGGQTLGKMIAGIRVVSSEPGGTVDIGHSVVRTLVWGLLAIPAGLGFISTLSNPDRRGLHDRCAGTRVVRAAA